VNAAVERTLANQLVVPFSTVAREDNLLVQELDEDVVMARSSQVGTWLREHCTTDMAAAGSTTAVR
jgi:hypothetical protein